LEYSMAHQSKAIELGSVLVTGGAGFLGANLATALLDRGHKVRVFDLAPCQLQHQNLELVQGDICEQQALRAACSGIDRVFHTASVIETRSGKAVSAELRDKVFAINVGGTAGLLAACREQGVKRCIYTSSNSVVIGGKPLCGVDESSPYTTRFAELYTETKVAAEKLVLEANGEGGVLCCAIRPSGIWGAGDKVMFYRMIERLIAGEVTAILGDGTARLDNSYIGNLVHGHILAAERLVPGAAAGQAYFINDGEAVNMMAVSRPLIEALGYTFPSRHLPFRPLWLLFSVWQLLHFRLRLPPPPLTPLALERICIDNHFSIDKARRQLGYQPLYTSAQGMEESMPYYRKLYDDIHYAMEHDPNYAASTF
jgi:3beta-hydroxy-delta5-steroid dehydrogenase/steroid delta-isomerase